MAAKIRTIQVTPGFFKSIPSSIYSPSFYAGIAGRSFWKGFWYLAGVTFLLMVAWSVFVILLPYLANRDKIESSVKAFLNFYPEELVITIQDGKASSNVEEPYFIPFTDIFPNEEWFQEMAGDEWEGELNGQDMDLKEMNLAVIDTKTPFSAEQFMEYKTIIWLTQDTVYVPGDSEGSFEALPLSTLEEDIVIDKALADQGLQILLHKVMQIVPILIIPMFIFIFIGVMIFRMIYLLIYALAQLIIFSIMKLPYDYAAAYKMGFYSITLSTVGPLLLAIQPWFPQLNGFFLMPTILSLLVATVNLDGAKKAELIKEKA